MLIAVAMLVALVAALAVPAAVDRAEERAAPVAFNPGLIISDYNFFNPSAMTEEEIQAFLEARTCSPADSSSCLWEYRESTTAQPNQGSGHCTRYAAARNEPASRIIAKVARACTISPRVLLVLMQKEQSLITRPTASGYLRATGYACPDTADCDARYFGFFNQVYRAAWQFRQYTQEPERAYKIGTVDVGFHPDAACGAEPVGIQNQATANLYNYTPYQPNSALLARPGTDGDSCSAFGNLNFWRFYTRWFGSTDTEPFPSYLDQCLNLAGGQACEEPNFFARLSPLR
ncbi:hypothetical protein SAMN05216282_12041 [Cryobacterium psychrotolerans]|uniref:Hemagglutinin n=1 Tax=Cryobacterium psychrotolerans TaxID=386301 RepID=A0A1G9G904_9MICO|nr:hypothetical protein [Cryobacterium psychrotolerans]SDK97169.1 hypothetical protein SAMN05216282_12041 [Cryobacterium psychrotolerans]